MRGHGHVPASGMRTPSNVCPAFTGRETRVAHRTQTLPVSEACSRSDLAERLVHASLRLGAEPLQGGPEQGTEEAGQALEGELGGVGHLGVGIDAAEAHGVDGDDRLVLSAQLNALTRDEVTHDIGQLSFPAEEPRGVEVGGADSAVAVTLHGDYGARVPLGGRGEVRKVTEHHVQRLVDHDGLLHSHGVLTLS